MSHKVAFLNDSSVVVQVLVGELNEQQQDLLLRDYRVLYGSVMAITVPDGQTAWIGGLYDPIAGEFSPPEPQPEPLLTETVPDDAI